MRPNRRERPTVLVVDDSLSVRELLELHLSKAGYNVRLAADAIAASRSVIESRPDLAIVAVNMPFMTGYEFVAALKADEATREIPVVFLSSDEDVGAQARRLGAVAYLQKPVLADRLLDVVALYVVRQGA